MEFGVTASKIDEVGFIAHAENLGYTHCWVRDSQMMWSHPFAVLALAAERTRTIRLGTGVAVAGLRLAPVTANAIATINRLAPGRTFLGLGTGNTAMRAMGQAPMRLAAFRDYIRVVRGLLRGEEVDYTLNGRTHRIRFLLREYSYLDLEHPIPLIVAGLGPKAQALAGELGDGLLTGIPRGGTVAEARGRAAEGAARAGRDLGGFHTAVLINLALLAPGESLTSDRVLSAWGANIMGNVHYLVDLVKERGMEPPDYVKPIWNDYLRFHAERPPELRHQQLHGGHSSRLDPAEARFVTPELVRAFCVAGRPEEVVEQIRELERQGASQVLFSAPEALAYRIAEDFAEQVMARY